MSEQRIFWDYEEYLGTILAKGDDPLGKLAARKGRASGSGRGFEIQDAGSAEPS